MDVSSTEKPAHPLRWPVRSTLLIAVVSAIVGAGWALSAPVEQLVSVGGGRGVVLTGESAHQFDAVAYFVCLGAAVGVVTALAAWTAVAQRGPRLVASTTVGSVLGAVVMAGAGTGVGLLRYPSMPSAEAGDIVSLAPSVITPIALLAQPLAAGVALVLAVALCGYDDLRGPGDEPASRDDPDPTPSAGPDDRRWPVSPGA